jgi:hypothetical protein
VNGRNENARDRRCAPSDAWSHRVQTPAAAQSHLDQRLSRGTTTQGRVAQFECIPVGGCLGALSIVTRHNYNM